MSVVRHFTATAYVVHDGRVALHWHPKVKAWLPPGGHVEENEDPVRAVLRETEEETGLKTEVVPTGPAIDLSYPVIVQPPLTIMVEDIHGQYGAGRPASRAGPGQWPIRVGKDDLTMNSQVHISIIDVGKGNRLLKPLIQIDGLDATGQGKQTVFTDFDDEGRLRVFFHAAHDEWQLEQADSYYKSHAHLLS